MAINHGYIGRAPSDSTVKVARQIFNVSGVTTNFTFESGYDVGYLDVFLNGSKLINGNDYVASDTSTIIILNGGALDGDVVEAVAYKAFNLATSGSVGVSSGGVTIGNASTLNFIGTGNTFAVNGSTIDVSISGGSASVMTVGVRVGTAVTFNIPTSNTLDVVGRSSTINVPV